MNEFSPKPTEILSLDVVEASANRTVSNRFKGLGEKARSVARMVTQRTVLTGTALGLLISSGCQTGEYANTPTHPEPTPISTPVETVKASPAAESVKTQEKEALTDVEFVRNLLRAYLVLDVDPNLKKLEDLNQLSSETIKVIQEIDPPITDLNYAIGTPKKARLGTFDSYPNFKGIRIQYIILSANITILVTAERGKTTGIYLGFNIDKEGNIVLGGDPRLNRNERLPGRDEADRLVLSATRNAARFLKNKPNEWSMDPFANNWEMSVQRGMISSVGLPNGENIKYSVGGTGEQPLAVGIHITKGK